MSKPHQNRMKHHRKRKMLKQSDMRHLSDASNHITLSRYENGDRIPSLESALIYHIVLNEPMKKLFPQFYKHLSEKLSERAKTLISSLEQMKKDYTTKNKIDYLNELINRIGCLQEVYDEKPEERK